MQSIFKHVLSAVDPLISKQTGCLHYYHGAKNQQHDAIPLYENFLLVLVLLRTGEVDSVRKGRQLCERLLAFEAKGFPAYMHLFPQVDTRKTSRILFLFALMLNKFSLGLGETLSGQLRQILISNLHLIDNPLMRKTVDFLFYGVEFDFQEMFDKPKDSYNWGTALLCFSVINPSIKEQKTIFNLVEEVWDFTEGIYKGDYANEKYEGIYRKQTLLDFILEPYSKRVLPRVDCAPIQFLLKALAFPVFAFDLPYHKKGSFTVLHGASQCLSKVFNDQILVHIHDETPFELLLLSKKEIKVERNTDSLLSFTCDAEEFNDGVDLYCTRGISLLQKGKQATYFRFDHPLEIKTAKQSYELHIKTKGGHVHGSCSLGNRPSQLSRKSCDYVINLRGNMHKEVTFTLKSQSLKQAESKETPIACNPLST